MSRLETDGPGDESEAVSRYLGSPLFEVTFQSISAVMTLEGIMARPRDINLGHHRAARPSTCSTPVPNLIPPHQSL
jgi:hypothetical protein